MPLPRYFDYAATTPVDPAVAEAMMACLTADGNFGNPASRSHIYGWQAEQAVELARKQLASLIGADIREIVWTSGATESNNLALKGAALALKDKGRHIISSMIEHKAVLDTLAELAQQGFEVTYLQPDQDGLISLEQVRQALRPDTVLASLMHVNNEIGTITDIAAIAKLLQANDVVFHVDAAQSLGKLPVNVDDLGVDLMSMSAHKMYGPKGIGALYVRRKPGFHIQAQIHGGGHERGMRSGTLATHQIVGMGAAAKLAAENLASESLRLTQLRDEFLQEISRIDDCFINGSLLQRVPANLNLSFADIDGELLMMSLKDLAVSTGSACTSASLEPSYVLKAIGLSDALAHSAIRFSLGRYTSAEDVSFAAQKLTDAVKKLRSK